MLYDNIKRLCAERGISILSIEKALNFSNGSICKWNENEPSVSKMKKVANYFNVPIEYFLNDTDDKKAG